MRALHNPVRSDLEDARVRFGRAAPLVRGAVRSSAAFGPALLQVARKAGALEVLKAVVIARLAVVGLGARRATADDAKAAGRVTLEDDSPALVPVTGKAGASSAASPSAHLDPRCAFGGDRAPTSSRTVHHRCDSRTDSRSGAVAADRFDEAGGDAPAGMVGSEDGDGRVVALVGGNPVRTPPAASCPADR